MAVLVFGTFTCEADHLHGPSVDLMVNVMTPVFSPILAPQPLHHKTQNQLHGPLLLDCMVGLGPESVGLIFSA